MKNFFVILFLILFIMPSQINAEDLRDFEIEGMTIGDSLLKYFDESYINKELKNKDIAFYYEDDFVTISTWDKRDKFNLYDDVGVVLKPNDKTYEIFGLEGTIYFKDKTIGDCYKKQDEISNDINNLLYNNYKKNVWFVEKNRLPKHQLSLKFIDFDINGGGSIRVACYEIQEGIKKYSDYHLLLVIINSSTFRYYLENEYKQ